ncbi:MULTISPECIES: CPXCG motif-containing cysteine-rich protein [Persicobacter]|uniref:CPXCG motif-containing cysteine-rich protein n=1 Tax=Persicobacter diffluens TaxID=981 RepID=A0AAN4VZ49_9BACT|nr:CPXCG motif-containing cysteine-rich protein [Persicobacter sp. CCB-QB2]GJM62423.1 hypothetical protein PEDI_29750 [Persicobacter diffluens]
MFEQWFICPYCLAEISVLLDPSVDHQEYIEDCEVCCRPIEIAYQSEEGDITYFNAHPAQSDWD